VPFTLSDYFQKYGINVVLGVLQQQAVGKSPTLIRRDDLYRQTVVQPAWERLPAPIRMRFRKDFDKWEKLFFSSREELFQLGGKAIELQPEAQSRLGWLLAQFCPPEQPPTPSVQPQPQPSQEEATFEPDPEESTPAATRSATPSNAPAVRSTGVGPSKPVALPVSDLAVGIDLGTTYSLIAYVDAQGRPVCIPNAQGELLTPSVVFFDEEGSIVGKEAVAASVSEPDRVADVVKRDMGNKHYRKKIRGEFMPPEVISSLILRSLKMDAERKFGASIRRAVITVPAYFEETRRRATMDAGRLAGLEVLDIINEPTAAAIAYGYNLGFLDRTGKAVGDRPLRVLVFDLGGGTFDVTIVEIQGTNYKALATDGDVYLGGKDWDARLLDLAAERFKHHFREDPRDNPFSLQELLLSVETAKRTLTERRKATIYVNHLGSRLKIDVTREEFEEATAALVERTRMTTEIVTRQAGLTFNDIDRVLLVGGSTRMPMIRRMLRELTGKEPESSINPDEAVAQGAALYAELLAPRTASSAGAAPSFTVTNVNSHSLGILGSEPGTGRKFNKILIPKNTPLPHTVTKVFKTFRENQASVAIKVLEGESDRPEVCTLIGTCAIRDLPTGLPVGWPVKVSYTYEANGRLHVRAELQGHKSSVTAEFERENRMADEDVDLWMHCIDDEMKGMRD